MYLFQCSLQANAVKCFSLTKTTKGKKIKLTSMVASTLIPEL